MFGCYNYRQAFFASLPLARHPSAEYRAMVSVVIELELAAQIFWVRFARLKMQLEGGRDEN